MSFKDNKNLWYITFQKKNNRTNILSKNNNNIKIKNIFNLCILKFNKNRYRLNITIYIMRKNSKLFSIEKKILFIPKIKLIKLLKSIIRDCYREIEIPIKYCSFYNN